MVRLLEEFDGEPAVTPENEAIYNTLHGALDAALGFSRPSAPTETFHHLAMQRIAFFAHRPTPVLRTV